MSCCTTCCGIKRKGAEGKLYPNSTIVLKITQIVVIVLSISSTEGILIFLNSLHIPWKKDYISLDINRVTLWSSLVTTLVMLVATIRKYNNKFYRPTTSNACTSCSGYQELGPENNKRKTPSRWSLSYLDFAHSFVIASSFLSCTFWLVVNIPSDYDHHMEVGIKVVGFVSDLFLGLLFTKSCVIAYTDYIGLPPCDCDDQHVFVSSIKDEHSSDENEIFEKLISSNHSSPRKVKKGILNRNSSI